MQLKLFCLSLIVVIQFSSTINSETSDPGSYILVRIFYETKCSDSMDFIENELRPVFKVLGDCFQIRFVPYGKAKKEYNKQDALWYFTCQHGHDECRYNMLHACALSLINNRDSRVGFISCLMTTYNEDTVLKKCADMFKVDQQAIQNCVYNSKQGNHLLAGYGNETDYYFPDGIKFVPTITVNGVYKQEDQDLALRNFEKLVCKYAKFYYPQLPECCKKCGQI